MVGSGRLVAVLLRRAWRWLRRRVGPADLYLFGCACCWLALFWIVPPAGFHALRAAGLLQVKNVWLYPAIAGVVVPPLGWFLPWRHARSLALLYKAGYWAFLAAGTADAVPGIPPFWGICALNVGAIFWIIAQEGAERLRRGADAP